MRKLKSIASLRFFESAARLLSFKLAAAELYVSPTAVSHQIRALEDDLECRLFERKTRQVLLTREGQELYTSVRKAFDSVDETIQRVRLSASRDVVTLGIGPIIGTRWLAPRLGDFWMKHLDIDLRLHHSALPMQQSASQFDLAIAWGDGRWPGVQFDPFMQIQVTPVFAKTGKLSDVEFDDPQQLLNYPLIHQRDRAGWNQWLRAAGVELSGEFFGTVIDDANLGLQTALTGQGIALGILPFVEDDVNAGRLCRPFALAVNPEHAYFLIYDKKQLAKRAVATVREWLLEQAQT
ncbi:MAG: LysR substrate-binding domain-containing protein [Pseudomonadota bacterium]